MRFAVLVSITLRLLATRRAGAAVQNDLPTSVNVTVAVGEL